MENTSTVLCVKEAEVVHDKNRNGKHPNIKEAEDV